MISVKDLVRKKGSHVFAVKPDSMVVEALALMAEKNTGAVMVMSGTKVVGILSERDCVRKGELLGKTAKNTKVSEMMTSKVLYVETSQSLEECMAIMIDNYQKFMISQLEHYISGTHHS